MSDDKIVIQDDPRCEDTRAPLKQELERIKALSQIALDLGLQQLTVGDILIVPSPITTSNRAEAAEAALELEKETKNNSISIDEDEDAFFPELSKAQKALKDEEAELRRIEEAQDDPDLFNSSMP